MRQVVWGWRRSTWDEASSRLVYFSADCEYLNNSAKLHDSRLVMIRRGDALEDLHEEALKIKGAHVEFTKNNLSLSIGSIRGEDEKRIESLDAVRRHVVRDLSHVHQTHDWQRRLDQIGSKRPHLIVYVGSGLSYESGIPTLPSMHKLFGVDGGLGTEFCLGPSDPLMDILNAKTFLWFVGRVQRFHSACVRAQPSPSHRHLQRAYRQGRVSLVLTDNVDDILERRFAMPTLPTRGDGLTSQRYAGLDDVVKVVQSSPHAMLVVGVSADRRGIIESLAKLMPTIVVNPALPVSPSSKNLDYLEPLGFNETGESKYGHVFIKQPARKCMGKVLSLLSKAV